MLPPTPTQNFISFELDFDVKFPLLRLLLFLSDLEITIFLVVLQFTNADNCDSISVFNTRCKKVVQIMCMKAPIDSRSECMDTGITVDENIIATIKIRNNYVAFQSFIFPILQ